MRATVKGHPAGQGSWVAFSSKTVQIRCASCGRGHCKPIAVASNSVGLTKWRKAVNQTFKSIFTGHDRIPKTTAVRVELEFRFYRPGKPTYAFPVQDVDKLARAVLDALTGTAYDDDLQVIELIARKRYVSLQTLEGVVVLVEPAQELPQLALLP